MCEAARRALVPLADGAHPGAAGKQDERTPCLAAAARRTERSGSPSAMVLVLVLVFAIEATPSHVYPETRTLLRVVGRSSFTLVLLVSSLLAGCYQRHAPWERAAPDGSALSMRVELTGGRVPSRGFVEVRFDGTYAASPMNELRVCTGTLGPEALDAWIALIERTGAFDREGVQGPDISDGGSAVVRLASEDGLATTFTMLGGPAAGWDPALDGFRRGAEDLWATLDIESCAPAALDPATTYLSAWIHPFDPLDEAQGSARLEVAPDGAVRGAVGFWWSEDDELETCAPLAESELLWDVVLASAPFDVRDPDGWRSVGVGVSTEVLAADGTTHERWVYGWMQSSRPEQVALEDALLALVETHCPP